MAKKSSKNANFSTKLDFLDLKKSSWDLYVSKFNTKVPRKSDLHSHSEGQLIWVLQGTLYLQTENKEWVVTPDRAIWVPPHFVHSAYSLRPIEIRTVYIKENVVEKQLHLFQEKCLLMTPLLHELILYGAKFSYTQPPLPFETAACELFLHLVRDQKEEENYLPRVKDIRLIRCWEVLIDNLDQNLLLEEIAKKARVSKRTLTRLIHDQLHISFSDWKNSIKIFHSLSLLLETKNVTEVAYELGFDSPNSFIRSFKKIKGITPKTYIKMRNMMAKV